MRANCESQNIKVFKDSSLSVNKESVALVVVMLDIVIAAFFYGSFVYLKFLE